MVGLCGEIGRQRVNLDRFAERIAYRGSERISTFSDEDFGIAAVDHPTLFTEQPIRLADGDLLWLWGTVFGVDVRGQYYTISDDAPPVEFVARLIDEHGWAVLPGLNGNFAGVRYDKDSGSVSLITDRLGTHPLYTTRTAEGSILFSSLIQSLSVHPGVSLSFDRRYLSEFLHYHRSLGCSTPVSGVSQLPPASVVTFETDGSKSDEWTYWWPNPVSRDESFSAFVDRFVSTFREAVNDRVDRHGRTGLFLSGGIDSRAILAVLGDNTVAFHLNEQRRGNLEAELAATAAETANADFIFLRRSVDHYPSVLDTSGEVTNFNGYFRVANHLGFEETISERVHCMLNGQYSDTLIGPTYVPMNDTAARPINDVQSYVEAFDAGEMGGHAKSVPFLDELPTPTDVLVTHISEEGERVTNHGVPYPSWEAMVQFGMIYPITNVRSFLWYETQIHCFPTQYPYLDNRIVDLILKMPADHRYGNDLVGTALKRLDPELAYLETLGHHPAVFHLLHAPPTQLLGDVMKFTGIQQGSVTLTDPESHLAPQSGFPHTPGIICSHPFLEELFEEESEAIEAANFIDTEALWDCYNRHLDGENFTDRLFGIASILSSTVPLETGPD